MLAAGGGQGAVCSDGTLVLNDVEFIRHAPEQLAWLSVDEMSMLSPASSVLTMVINTGVGRGLAVRAAFLGQSEFLWSLITQLAVLSEFCVSGLELVRTWG